MLLMRAGYPTLTPSGGGRQDLAQDQRTVFTHHVSLLEAYKPYFYSLCFPFTILLLKCIVNTTLLKNKKTNRFLRIKIILKRKLCLIIQICRSHNTFYTCLFWTNSQTKSMLIQITQQLLSIDLAGPHIQIAMGNVDFRSICANSATKLNLFFQDGIKQWVYINTTQY